MDVQETDGQIGPEKEETVVSTQITRGIKARLGIFIENYAQCGRVLTACRAAGINHNTHYRKLQSDPDYRARVEAAEQAVAQQVEDRVFDLAMEGELPAALALLRRFRPQHYRERSSVEVSGSIDLVTALTQARNRMVVIDADDTRKAG